MTIQNVIDRVRLIKTGCVIDDSRVIEDINRVENYIIKDIVSKRTGDEAAQDYGNYDEETPRDRELLAPAPYDTVYVDYCCAQIDREYEDSERYVNSMASYNNGMTQLKKWWWQNHRQKKLNRFYERGF